MNKSIKILVGLGSLAAVPSCAFAVTAEQACTAMSQMSLTHVHIQKTEWVKAGHAAKDKMSALTGASAAGNALPAHCRINGAINERIGADGKKYAIQFELRMPTNWHGEFLFQGGGGLDGFVANAVGSIPVHGATAAPALQRGFAVVSMDGGHEGRNAEFAHDQQARLDYAYQAVGKVTSTAKQLIRHYYNEKITHSYFMGCSNGGREAMIAAERYPTEFNGIIAGDPGFRLSHAAIGEVWDTQILSSIAPKDKQGKPILSQAFSQAELNMVSKAIVQECDGKDGLKDGIINNYPACHFNPVELQCKNGEVEHCLSKNKVDALNKVFAGAKNSQGNTLYSSWPFDTGIASKGWRLWKLGNSNDANKPNALNIVLGRDSLVNYYMTPPNPNFDLMKFDFDKDPARIAETSAINDANATYLNTFKSNGGKILIYQGISDPVFSADDIKDWYNQVEQHTSNGNKTEQRQWARLFMVPGMTHCGDGPGLDNFDPLTVMQHWVENGQAPERIIAQGKAFPGKKQPLCVYPKIAFYKGQGDVNNADSFECH
ncbi:tannase/feruloyl esterase family alpha/beta hydrolase [Vibrio nitrifigilis]|uniref:Tannase/feruloyl esterase family alpha/beta hydrolase n=1 Tax=Vibrio nitrifigilis TaxID=2789781 RepID=A0ABS0GL41_9VIBR|nr:tannase/feruloyl esterase family alpha/beta hydrolase [Vibrio nitrifigilis]MBF9003156.1 tannase/feruloyl esterase family alpha/beta hydrolase [Vibrio nitrifigilis]